MQTQLVYNLMSAVSDFGGSPIIIGVIAFSFAFYLFEKRIYNACLLLLASLGSYPYGLILKELFKIPRPDGAIIKIYFPPDVFGFPSTHTVIYTAFWGMVLYLTYKLSKQDKYLMHVMRFFSLFLISMVGVSRVYLGVHSIYDVVGGYVFGVIYLLVLITIDTARLTKTK